MNDSGYSAFVPGHSGGSVTDFHRFPSIPGQQGITHQQYEDTVTVTFHKVNLIVPSLVADHSPPSDTSVAFLKLELLCDEHFPCICPGEGMGSVPVVSFDIEHDLINQFLF